MAKQDQSVGDGARAYQAVGSITVHEGLSADDMMSLMGAMARQLSAYTTEANEKLEQRFSEFREEVLRQFADGKGANKEAFNDPDFQFTVRDAQEAYAKKGTPDLGSELVRLLAERSRQPTGSRVANILGEAIKIAGALTREEVATLAVLFVVTQVGTTDNSQHGIRNFQHTLLAPFVSSLPSADDPFIYLESLRCITINRVVTRTSDSILHDKFGSQFQDQDGSSIRKFMAESEVLKVIFDQWDGRPAYQQSFLTSLGTALGHSALVSKAAFEAPVNIWLK